MNMKFKGNKEEELWGKFAASALSGIAAHNDDQTAYQKVQFAAECADLMLQEYKERQESLSPKVQCSSYPLP
jgi:hypothetical protein